MKERKNGKMTPRIMFEQELEDLRVELTEMGQRVEGSYNKLVSAANKEEEHTLKQLLDVDRQIIDMQRSIEAKCLYLVTKEQPVARDLRTISAALKVVTDIERIGVHVADMAELFLRMGKRSTETVYEQKLQLMLEETGKMLHSAIEAFVQCDIPVAEQVIAVDDVIDDFFNEIKNAMMNAIRNQDLGADDIVDYLMLAKYLEKIGDHAVNIGEWTKFGQTGDMQGFRLY